MFCQLQGGAVVFGWHGSVGWCGVWLLCVFDGISGYFVFPGFFRMRGAVHCFGNMGRLGLALSLGCQWGFSVVDAAV